MNVTADAPKCRTCGATLNFPEGKESVPCEYCRVVNFLQKRVDEKLIEETTRSALNAAVSVVSGQVAAGRKDSIDAAVGAFLKSDLKLAQKTAEGIIREGADSPEAQFILAFCEYVSKSHNPVRLNEFFSGVTNSVLLPDQTEALKKMFLKFPSNLSEFEKEIIRCMEKLDDSDLCAFVDAFSPYIIKKRDIAKLDPELISVYCGLAKRFDIPKTCYALLGSVTVIPGSPYTNNTFHLHTSANKFRSEYLLPIGTVIQSMRTDQLRTQFYGAYQKRLQDFDSRMK